MYSFYPLGTTLSLNQLLGDPWKHCKDAQGRQGHVEVQLFYENHCKFKKKKHNPVLVLLVFTFA